MSNKPHNKLNPFDAQLRECFPVSMMSGTQIIIRKIIGFELFNTRNYHNYETWSDGYEVTDGKYLVREEDLDDAMQKLMDLRTGKREPKNYDMLLGKDKLLLGPFAEDNKG